jgi:hypothetical protein
MKHLITDASKVWPGEKHRLTTNYALIAIAQVIRTSIDFSDGHFYTVPVER